MNPEGQIDITLTVLPSGKKEVAILNNRPVHAAKLLVGKNIDEALRIIPLLYHVCGKAQGAAAISAIEAAQNKTPDKATLMARTILSDVELIREHLLRIFLDWPLILDGDEQTERAMNETADFMKLMVEFERALFQSDKPFSIETTANPDKEPLSESLQKLETILEKTIFGCSPDLWLKAKARDVIFHWMRQDKCLSARCCDRLLKNEWAQEGQTSIPFLPNLSATECASLLFANDQRLSDDFIGAPTWQGSPHETSSLSRCHKHPLIKLLLAHCGTGLLTRYVSRLVELALILLRMKRAVRELLPASEKPDETPPSSLSSTPSFGIGMVEAARGLLVHGVLLEGDKIRDYKILAPTEWNFHPKGVLSSTLSHITSKDETEIKTMANLLIPAIDPCTKTSLEVTYA